MTPTPLVLCPLSTWGLAARDRSCADRGPTTVWRAVGGLRLTEYSARSVSWGEGEGRPHVSLSRVCPSLPSSRSPRQPPVCFLSLDLSISDISWKWSHTALVLLCLASVTQRDVLRFLCAVARVAASFLVWPDHIPGCGWTVFCLSIRPLMDAGLFPLLAAVNTSVQGLIRTLVFKWSLFLRCRHP